MKRIRFICTILVLVIGIFPVIHVLEFKFDDGNNCLTAFYELPENSVDILSIGSSHAFANINPQVFWDAYGYASYNLGASCQPMWNSWHYLVEALKYQKPSVILLDAYEVNYSAEYFGDPAVVIKNTAGLRWSVNKIRAIAASADKKELPGYMLEYTQYHSRYKELSYSDFQSYNGRENVYKNWKGFRCNYITNYFEPPDIQINSTTDLPPKSEKYFRKIIELAQAKQIPIVVVVSPYCVTAEEEQGFNRAFEIAADYGVDFLDFNKFYEQTGIHYTDDFSDVGHLNYRGTQKYTQYLADYIHENYMIEDKRNQARYQSWEEHAKYLKMTYIEQELTECTDPDLYRELLKRLDGDDYTIVISGDDLGHTIGMVRLADHLYICNRNRQYIENDTFYTDLGVHTLKIGFADKSYSIQYDHADIKKTQTGVNVVVYNNYSETFVDSVGFELDDAGNDRCIR